MARPIAANVHAQLNPLLDAARDVDFDPGPDGADRTRLARRFAYAIPGQQAIAAIANSAPPAGIVEIGAGLGYWAHQFEGAGVDVAAYDRHPPPSPENRHFDLHPAWHPVDRGTELDVDGHGDRLLLVVWPTRDEGWAAETLTRFHRAGGETVAYVGEGPGGPTGDDCFHRLLGNLDTCLACRHGVVNSPCVCHLSPLWTLQRTVRIPRWRGQDDALHLFRRSRPRLLKRPGRRTRKRGEDSAHESPQYDTLSYDPGS